MGVRIPPRLPFFEGRTAREVGEHGVPDADPGVLPRGGGGVSARELADPRRGGAIDGGGARRRRRALRLSRRRRRPAVQVRGGDSAMSDTGTTTKQWYVVHTYSGFENKVATAIESRAKIFGLSDMIGRVVVPNEKVQIGRAHV